MKSDEKVPRYLFDALDCAEAVLEGGDGAAARGLLTGLEARLLVAGLGASLPRFFRLAAECERQAGELDEAIRLVRKGLARLTADDDDERGQLVRLGRRIIEEVEDREGLQRDREANDKQHG